VLDTVSQSQIYFMLIVVSQANYWEDFDPYQPYIKPWDLRNL
jgi:hypothetical protein